MSVIRRRNKRACCWTNMGRGQKQCKKKCKKDLSYNKEHLSAPSLWSLETIYFWPKQQQVSIIYNLDFYKYHWPGLTHGHLHYPSMSAFLLGKGLMATLFPSPDEPIYFPNFETGEKRHYTLVHLFLCCSYGNLKVMSNCWYNLFIALLAF